MLRGAASSLWLPWRCTLPDLREAWCVQCLASNETLQELCRKESLICKCLGITRKNLNNYEVEYICDHKIEKGNEYFLVKWKGWPESHNTWEPKENLKCPTLLKQFYSDVTTRRCDWRGHKMAATRGAWCVQCLASNETLQELCRKESLICKCLGITRKNLNNYEVEYICDHKIEKGNEYFLVKWKGWPDSHNTWEPKENLKCPTLLKQFYSDLYKYLSELNPGKASVLKNSMKSLDRSVADYVVKKAKQRIALKRWEDELNRKKSHHGMLYVENDVDLNGPPRDFYYINDYKASPGVNTLGEAVVGCECTDCFTGKCCPTEAGVGFAYNEHRQIKIQPGRPIYECNARCKCGPDCPNRVVQKGPPYSLCIFRTHNGRGWGVKTLQKIKKHSFVMEYVGEVITSEEAERRGQQYDSTGITYLFDLDYESDEFTVDAARYGNVSHFVNHSCDPNLQVYNVFIDNLDVRLPRIALFSTRQIKAGEELTFDYQMKGSGDLSTDSIEMSPAKKRVRTACRCGAAICRGYL